jgi:hypothetical protein
MEPPRPLDPVPLLAPLETLAKWVPATVTTGISGQLEACHQEVAPARTDHLPVKSRQHHRLQAWFREERSPVAIP